MNSTPNNETNPASGIKLRKAIYPMIIGLGVVGYMFYRDFNPKVFDDVHFTFWSVLWLLMAMVCMLGRDFGYMIRIKILSGGALSWRQSFRVIMLWEFTSAITPSAVGGTSVALLYVHKEGIPIGRSTAIVMLTSFLDEIYFILMFPLLMAIVGFDNLFEVATTGSFTERGIVIFAMVGYALKFLYVIMLSYGLFYNPRGLKWMLLKLFKLKYLKRWRKHIDQIGTDIVVSADDMKRKGFKFWGGAFGSTFLSWSSRYMVANMLIMAFFSVSDQFLLFARQLVMWVIMLVMPTPGGSGFAEYIFTDYCSDLITVPVELQIGAALLIAFLWRVITYYPYLLVGAIIFPRWIKRSF